MITIYSFIYNEGVFLQYMIDFYRARFPNCHIVIIDNQSTDNSAQIALNNNCEVIGFNSNNEINDDQIIRLKNSCWKNAKTNWVGVVDCDELLNINEQQLLSEQNAGTSIIKPQAFTMVNMTDNFDFDSIKHGVRDTMYDKTYFFDKSLIQEINFVHGAHVSSPLGVVKYNETPYNLYHYKYINQDYHIERSKYTFHRLSALNKKQGWGIQWHVNEEQIKQLFAELRQKATKVIQ